MPPFHLASTSRALYRVFIAPTLPTPLQPLQSQIPIFLPSTTLIPQTQIRGLKFKKPVRQSLSDAYILDDAIKSDTIHLIDLEGRQCKSIPLDQALRSIDRKLYHIIQVAPGEKDSSGRPNPEKPPTCKLVSKMDLRIRHNKKLDLERKAAKIAKGGGSKQLELNWAIGENDLRHRLKQLMGFLKQGKRVEVLLGPKRRGRAATPEECQAVLKGIREAVLECKGTSEVKVDGKVGAIMTMIYQGKKMEKEQDEKEEVEK